VQYDESDLHFIQRLCEEEGIHYHFQHSATAHTVVFGDDQTVFPRLAPWPTSKTPAWWPASR
jgi:type VI secretion system secreted protein VgrG